MRGALETLLAKRQMDLIGLYLTSAQDIPKPAPKCDKCVIPHIIQGSYIAVAYCTLCSYPMPAHTKVYAR